MLLHFRQRSSNRNSINEGGTILASPPLVSRWINAFISGSWSAAIYFARSNLDGSDREVAQIIARRTLNFIHNYTCFINNYIPGVGGRHVRIQAEKYFQAGKRARSTSTRIFSHFPPLYRSSFLARVIARWKQWVNYPPPPPLTGTDTYIWRQILAGKKNLIRRRSVHGRVELDRFEGIE